jgi:hypothetical protein
VEAVAVNPLDTKLRLSVPPLGGEPRVLGWDAAGHEGANRMQRRTATKPKRRAWPEHP